MKTDDLNLGTAHLGDDEFLHAFEECSLPNNVFRHADHVRLTWLYVSRLGEAAAAMRVIDGIQRYAAFHGANSKFNHTQTRAWVRLVAHACEASGPCSTFAEFAAASGWLFDKNALAAHYSQAVLTGFKAKAEWVEPDLAPLP